VREAANAGEDAARAKRRVIAVLVFITDHPSALEPAVAAQIVSVESSTRERGPSTTTMPLSVT
jgi:hypothetical protein